MSSQIKETETSFCRKHVDCLKENAQFVQMQIACEGLLHNEQISENYMADSYFNNGQKYHDSRLCIKP